MSEGGADALDVPTVVEVVSLSGAVVATVRIGLGRTIADLKRNVEQLVPTAKTSQQRLILGSRVLADADIVHKVQKLAPVPQEPGLRLHLVLTDSASEHVGELASESSDARRAGAIALGELGSVGALGDAADEKLEALASLLEDANPSVVLAAVDAMCMVGGPAMPYAAALLGSHLPATRSVALEVLSRAGQASAPHAVAVAGLLEHPDTSLRGKAVVALGRIGAAAEPYVPRMEALLNDESVQVRRHAASSLGYMAGLPTTQADRLLACLLDPDASVRSISASSLGRFRDLNEQQLETLAAGLDDADGRVRASVAAAFGGFGVDGARYAAKALHDNKWAVRSAAVKALGQIGPQAEQYVQNVKALLQDPNSGVREEATTALHRFGQLDMHIEEIVGDLVNSRVESFVRSAAAHVFSTVIQRAALPSQFRRNIFWADAVVELWTMRHLEEAKKLEARWRKAGDDDLLLTTAVRGLLGEIDTPAAKATAQIAALEWSQDSKVRQAGARAVMDIAAYAKPHADVVASQLVAKDILTQIGAMRVLYWLGAAAAAHTETIVKILDDSAQLLRLGASKTLIQIGLGAVPVIEEFLSRPPTTEEGESLGYNVLNTILEKNGKERLITRDYNPALASHHVRPNSFSSFLSSASSKQREPAHQLIEAVAVGKPGAPSNRGATVDSQDQKVSEGADNDGVSARSGSETPSPHATIWKVVGGAMNGGLIVRSGASTSSTQLTERLSKGALVAERELQGQRMSYTLVSGSGPARGWISVSCQGRELVVRRSGGGAPPPQVSLKAYKKRGARQTATAAKETAQEAPKAAAVARDSEGGAEDDISELKCRLEFVKASKVMASASQDHQAENNLEKKQQILEERIQKAAEKAQLERDDLAQLEKELEEVKKQNSAAADSDDFCDAKRLKEAQKELEGELKKLEM